MIIYNDIVLFKFIRLNDSTKRFISRVDIHTRPYLFG